MVGFPDPIKPRIFCVFKDRAAADLEIPQDVYDNIHHLSYHAQVIIEDKRHRIVFDGKRGEITGFKHVYPEERGIDAYEMNSHVYRQEKPKRDAFWKEHLSKMTQDQKDEVWSIIYSRWGISYKGDSNNERAWKSYFSGMFKIIGLEMANYKDKISSPKGIIADWTGKLELPLVYGNIALFRNLIKNGKENTVSELPKAGQENEAG